MFKRSSGVLAHVTSLPSPHGVGTMGKTARDFVDFLAAAHQTYWQVLPLGHTGFGDSPYQCFSAAAGNPYLIDMDLLVEDGLLTADEVRQGDFDASPDTADFEQLADTRWPLFRKAYSARDTGNARGNRRLHREEQRMAAGLRAVHGAQGGEIPSHAGLHVAGQGCARPQAGRRSNK